MDAVEDDLNSRLKLDNSMDTKENKMDTKNKTEGLFAQPNTNSFLLEIKLIGRRRRVYFSILIPIFFTFTFCPIR